jgi:sugar phosphate isomerase/epimerase
VRVGTILNRVPDSIGFFAGEDDWLDAEALVTEVTRLSEAGFQHVELSADLSILGPSVFTPKVIARLRDLAKERAITYSIHLHGTCSSRFGRYGVCLDSLDERVRKAAVRWLIDAVHRFLPLGVQHFVLHAVWGEGMIRHLMASRTLTTMGKEYLVSRFAQQAARSLAELTQVVPSRWLCLENLPTEFGPAYALADQFDTSVCFDGGHWLLQGQRLSEFVARYGSRIAMVHCHGAENGADHQPLTVAQAREWSEVLQILDARSISMPVVLQVPGEEATLASFRALQPAPGPALVTAVGEEKRR